MRLFVAAAVLIGGAFIGQAIGMIAGSKLHLALPFGGLRSVDRAAGAVAGVIGVVVAVWLLLPAMSSVPDWPSRLARNSAIARTIDEAFPRPPDTLQALRRLIGDDPFVQVFKDLQPAPDIGPPPAESGLSQEVARRVQRSTFRIEGAACDRIQEGSGFAVGGADLVVTNAHVVAGEDATTVVREDGSRLEGTVIVFDPDRDLAVLRVPGLDRPPLPLRDAGVEDRGAVFGYPGGGPLELSPYQVAREVVATGRDLYDTHDTRREVYFLSAELRPGDSGAPLVSPSGAVVGAAFAIAPDKPNVAYALTDNEVQRALAAIGGAPVETGPCLD
jgi:S1-C subfamily serine protease